jgi:ATP-binding cassette subfamily B (MDR/TAP) protein 1
LNPLTSRDYLFLLLPSCLLSIAAAVVPMYMTIIIGDAFGVFSGYPLDHSLATSEQSHKLVKEVGNFCLRLTLVGLAGWIVNCAMISLWVRVGEMVAHRLRKAVYTSVMARGMEWFDLGMGLKGEDSKDNSSADAEESVGAAGLMAKFTRQVTSMMVVVLDIDD